MKLWRGILKVFRGSILFSSFSLAGCKVYLLKGSISLSFCSISYVLNILKIDLYVAQLCPSRRNLLPKIVVLIAIMINSCFSKKCFFLSLQKH